MSWVDWGDAPTAIGALIALGAAGFTYWQASEAKKARIAADRQAAAAEEALAEAREQTKAAKTSAEAAQGAVAAAETQAAEARTANELAQLALEHDRAERDEAAGPQFRLSPNRRKSGVHPVEITMVSGPPSIDVNVSWVSDPDGQWINPTDNSVGGLDTKNFGPHVMAPGRTVTLEIQLREPMAAYEVIVDLLCEEITQDRTPRRWKRGYAAILKPPPQVRVHHM